MHPELTATTVRSPSRAPDRLLRQFVQAYWLRPENAFWMALRSRTLSACEWAHPLLDLSCGDGVFMFLHRGGSFDPDFDVFSGVGSLDRGRDEHADIFDRVTDDYRPGVRSLPRDTLDVGTDLKPTLLAKAGRLNFYRRLVEHDNEQPLPFGDASFRTVYCNAAYWVNGIDRFLREIARVTQPAGRVVLQIKLDGMRRYTLERHRHALGDRFMDIIGRGRLACWPTLTNRATWERRFAQAGFTIDDATPFITETHARIWVMTTTLSWEG